MDNPMMRAGICWIWLVAAAGLCSAQDSSARRVLARYDDLRPRANELGMYRLDWADSVDEALARANREERPILLVIIHAKYGDITGGHC
jgi:hypothetical protein